MSCPHDGPTCRHYQWLEIPTFDDPDLVTRGACLHKDTVPVKTLAEELVARLCLTCDKQLSVK